MSQREVCSSLTQVTLLLLDKQEMYCLFPDVVPMVNIATKLSLMELESTNPSLGCSSKFWDMWVCLCFGALVKNLFLNHDSQYGIGLSFC